MIAAWIAATLLLLLPLPAPAGALTADQLLQKLIPRVEPEHPAKTRKPRAAKRAPVAPEAKAAAPEAAAAPRSRPEEAKPDPVAAIPLPRPNPAADTPATASDTAKEPAPADAPKDTPDIGELAFAPPMLATPLTPTGPSAIDALGTIVPPGVQPDMAPATAPVHPPEAEGPPEASTPLPREKPDDSSRLGEVVPAAITPPRPPALPETLAACKAGMSALRISAKAEPPVHEGLCGAEDPYAVTALADGSVTLQPKATVNCETASMLARWLADDVQPAAVAAFGGSVTAFRIADSYSCRGRNQIAGAPLSEHGFMNAVDVAAFEIKGRWVTVEKSGDHTDADTAFIETIRHAACARFMTVLGPGSDGYHENHLHLDMRHRGAHGDSRYCH